MQVNRPAGHRHPSANTYRHANARWPGDHFERVDFHGGHTGFLHSRA